MSNKSLLLASGAEDKFIELFSEVFGIENTQYLAIQYPFVDMYGNNRYIDFALESDNIKIAIEVDGEFIHDKRKISDEKYYDELLRQNSMIHQNWKLYRWTDKQLNKNTGLVKDQLLHFIGEYPKFSEFTDYLPEQKGKIVELKEHQKEALENLEELREEGNSIALLYHATGERVIIVTGCINALRSRVSGTLVNMIHALLRVIKYNYCKQCMRSKDVLALQY